MVRMSPQQFDLLYNMDAPRLQKRSRRRPLSKKLRLIVTLNYLANGDSNRKTANFFRIGRSTTYKIISDWQIVARGFLEKWDFPNCLGAIDGKEIRIKKPAHLGSMYFNYKKFFSVKLLVACDAHYRFTWVDIGDYGSVSDYSSFTYTDFSISLENNEVDLPPPAELPRTNIRLPYCFIGDAIFPYRSYLIKPYDRNRIINNLQNNFNYSLARARNCIEDTFGLLTNKWSILNKRMDFKVENSITVVQALVCLHNFLITQELLVDEKERMYTQGNQCRQNVNNENNHNEEDNFEIPYDVQEQRNILAKYFSSEEGALR